MTLHTLIGKSLEMIYISLNVKLHNYAWSMKRKNMHFCSEGHICICICPWPIKVPVRFVLYVFKDQVWNETFYTSFALLSTFKNEIGNWVMKVVITCLTLKQYDGHLCPYMQAMPNGWKLWKVTMKVEVWLK